MADAASREASSALPEDQASTRLSTTSSMSNRYSLASSETGESSKRNSMITKGSEAEEGDNFVENTKLQIPDRKDTRRRSHKSANSGSFLLSNTISAPLSRKMGIGSLQRSPRDSKGKHVMRSKEKRETKPSTNGSAIGSNLASAAATGSTDGNGEEDNMGSDSEGHVKVEGNPVAGRQSHASTTLDLDSRQIVSLALNLSESRRLAQRRIVSTPAVPLPISTLGDGFAGGSLRHHLQQQRRSSRNISPKPDRGDRGATASPRLSQSRRMSMSLQPAINFPDDEEIYSYTFSASTLARAAKAKSAIELMAQYRNLLQYVPPLKPALIPRPDSGSYHGSLPNSPNQNTLSRSSSNTQRPLGRQYNPLQYIRNRTVRARERKTIDGEAQGFGNLEKVKSWVEDIAQMTTSDDFRAFDCVPLPSLETPLDPTSYMSPDHMLLRGPGKKVHRPRIGWVTNPADMLADVYWLEQGENKKSIENRRWQKIYPQHTHLTRPESRREEHALGHAVQTQDNVRARTPDLRLDTKLPDFKLIRNFEKQDYDVQDIRSGHKSHLDSKDARSFGDEQQLLQSSGSRALSDSSDSGRGQLRPRRERSNTTESRQADTNILEKQMLELLDKDAREHDTSVGVQGKSGQKVLETIMPGKTRLRDELEKRRNIPRQATSSIKEHSRNQSNAMSDESRQTSCRTSLEVPEARGRRSFEGLDTTAPNTPLLRAKGASAFVPPLGMSLSPDGSRQTSPTRNTLDKVRSKIPLFRDKSPVTSERGYFTADIKTSDPSSSMSPPLTPEYVTRRSTSPSKTSVSKPTDESLRSIRSTVSRRRDEELSGIKSLFKSGRNNVSRIGDMIWKRDPSSVMSSTDVSDDDHDRSPRAGLSRVVSYDPTGDLSPTKERRSLDLPSFTSPFERRGKDKRIRSDEYGSPTPEHMTARERHDSRRLTRLDLLRPPEISVKGASPGSSPDITPDRRGSGISDVSDLDRGETNVRTADARLNSILGLPGHSPSYLNRNFVFRTALSSIDQRPGSDAQKRQWSISDARAPSPSENQRTPMTRREFARMRALFVSSGVKAQEISRRANEVRDITKPDTDRAIKKETLVSDIVAMNRDKTLILKTVTRKQAHIVAAKILSNDMQLSSRVWQESAEKFSSETIGTILDRVDTLQNKIMGQRNMADSSAAKSPLTTGSGLSDVVKRAADEADEVSRDIIEEQTMNMKALTASMDRLMRRRRRRFRWFRKGGWVLLEWLLLGIMWLVWAVVVLLRAGQSVALSFLGVLRWLLWL